MDILKDPIYTRSNKKHVDAVLQDLDVSPPSDFIEFFKSYKGPFSSVRTPYNLADLCVGVTTEDSIPIATKALRRSSGLPEKFLAISNIVENKVFVYDTKGGSVFHVASEGGLNEVLLYRSPDFPTFSEFLNWYFD